MRHPAHGPAGALASANNRILAGVPRAEVRLLEPIEQVRLAPRYVLHEAGEVPRFLYFPAGGVVSLVHVDQRGAMPELAHVGAEGMVGVGALLGSERARHRAVVQIAGLGWRVPLPAARRAFAQSVTFRLLALKWTEALILQLSQNVICKLSHTVEQQVCQRLLGYADRVGDAALELTHEQIAESLGSRRQGITEAARKLQGRGMIAYSRGRVSVLDRETLERSACECYRVLRDACREASAPAASPPD